MEGEGEDPRLGGAAAAGAAACKRGPGGAGEGAGRRPAGEGEGGVGGAPAAPRAGPAAICGAAGQRERVRDGASPWRRGGRLR